MNLAGYTTAELGLKILRHQEGSVTMPAKMLAAVKAEIAARKPKYCGWHPARGWEPLSLANDAQTAASILMRMGVTAGNHGYEIREYGTRS